jgi:hypothetical protein
MSTVLVLMNTSGNSTDMGKGLAVNVRGFLQWNQKLFENTY